MSADVTPWGETYDDLAKDALADKSAPPALSLAAFLYMHGEQRPFRRLIDDALALDAKEEAET